MTDYGEKLWEPTPTRIEASRLHKFMRRVSEESGVTFASYADFHRWSVENVGEFWRHAAADLNLCWLDRPNQTFVPPPAGKMRGARWFPCATLNFADNLLRYPDREDAVIVLTEGEERRSYSGEGLRDQVAAVAAHLRSLGVGKGDRVAAVVTNGIEALVGMLATSSLGGIWASCSPDFGVNAIVDRLAQVEPKVLFYTTDYQYGGKRFACWQKLAEITAKLPTLSRTILCCSSWSECPADLGDNYATVAATQAEPLSFEPMAFDDPLYIMFSSGTTGVPKCITHGVGGTLLQHKKELAYHVDIGESSRLMYFTTCGWMMWNWMVSALSEGASLVLFDGSVAWPDLERLWQVVEEENVTVFGTSPKFIAACQQASIDPPKASALQTVLSTGAPLLPEQFAWIYERFPEVHLASISGGTDIISCFMLGVPTLPVYAGEIQAPGLGMDVRAVDDSGAAVTEEKGELTCATPFPSMPVCFWNDPDGSRYSKAYFERFTDPEIWHHGDFVSITKSGGVIVYGRSDATLNPGGVRIGTAEIYRQIEKLPEVADSIAVGRKCDGDTEIVLFLKMADGSHCDDEFVAAVKRHIRSHLTPRHVPAQIVAVPDIPYTRSGKKVELAVTQAIHGERVANVGALANPDALDAYYAFARPDS